MPARSVAELLGRPFEQLEIADVERLASDEGETVFFEHKEAVSRDSLAKACAAFANTLGGLLIVGVADDGSIVGTTVDHAEPQLWVKDTLLGRVVPLPPFRARWLPIDGGQTGLLLVLVERSSTTPHLLARRGAIYVRGPGSSDPLTDQRQLFELVRRGEDSSMAATAAAVSIAESAVHARDGNLQMYWTIGIAPTGTTASFEESVFRRDAPDRISMHLWGAEPYDRNREGRFSVWSAAALHIDRKRINMFSNYIVETVRIWRSGAIGYGWGILPRTPETGIDGETQSTDDLAERFSVQLTRLRHLALTLGAHGELAVSFQVDLRAGLGSPDASGNNYRPATAGTTIVRVDRATTLDPDDEHDAALRDSVVDEIRLTFGFPPLR